MERMIRMIEIALVIGRNLVLIVAAFTGITIAIATYNFAAGNIVWGLFDSAFGIAALVFLMQIRQTRRRHYRRRARYQEIKQKKYHEAQAA